MKNLLYIYLEDYSNFQSFELNLSNEFDISFNGEEIYLAEKTNLFKEVLGKNIYDINVIAGENGIGKTSLLKAITEILRPRDEDDEYYTDSYKYLLVYRLDFETIFIIHTLKEDYLIPPRLGPGMNNYAIEHSYAKNHDLDRPIIYYSPFLDFNLLDVYSKEKDQPVLDISMTQMVMNDLEKNNGYMDMTADFLFHKTKNIKRHLNFINETKDLFDLPFDLPQTINLHFNRLNPVKEDISTRGYMLFEKMTADCATQLRENSDDDSKKNVIAKILFLRNLLSMYFLSINGIKTQQVLHHNYSDALAEEILDFKSKDAKKLIKLIEKFFEQDDLFESTIFVKLIKLVYPLLSAKSTGIYLGNSNNLLALELKINNSAIGKLFEILNYNGTQNAQDKYIGPNLHKFVSFDWRNFSSGEKMFLDLFSRLHIIKPSLKDREKPLLILLDEGEVGLHPSWQIKYVSNLCKFLNVIFKDYHIQLIIATHSPLVLSDFPKERVHLFKKTADGKSRFKEDSFGTFAQNTSVLLANDFFIESSLIGDLAKKFINDILNEIDSVDNAIQVFASDLIERIEAIDEPIIKRLLLNKLNEIRYAQN